MQYHAFVIKYAEIGVKGKNRYIFEDALVKQLKRVLAKCDGSFNISKVAGRIYIEAEGFDFDETVSQLQTVFGVTGICPAVSIARDGENHLPDVDGVAKAVLDFIDGVYPNKNKTFKVKCRRVDKSYPVDSMEMAAELGGRILYAFPEMKVDVHDPEILINVELREKLNIFSEIIPGPGGMPIGTAGKAMLLLSGGIDSPVAGYMVAKRGVEIEAVYFNAPPYTSEKAKQKVIDLAGVIAKYTGKVKLHVINFTDIQMYIYEKCPHDELTIIMRRYMMRIADILAQKSGSMGLITGESIGQVASQTMQSLMCTGEVVTDIPVYRPLIAFDKQDIVDISYKIDAYETSILPYEDCCTIFVAKHPVTKPRADIIRKHEENLVEKIDELMQTALDTDEVIEITR
ncbi:thiamine biosynthesis protein ThiI [Butyrivibrio hungatei DSM 14810]|uniref:Probable tRNA sulfurtransferase n=1 Tax=Butyrivibrio hungatei DSM 14810 TaxID=1121132 RepID=A0A1M7SVX3_9FIRM|nr:tRNA uracil 4-sulfurtransferase ThiI [Butyrivibrio hungatei]SHN62602.1 thiamine biosynthesis protein ThiI [Butyrivibrio hungatei DSM 14810]